MTLNNFVYVVTVALARYLTHNDTKILQRNLGGKRAHFSSNYWQQNLHSTFLLFSIISMHFTILGIVVLVNTLVLISASEISLQGFNEKVLKDERVWLVEFYSSMCGSCQEFTPIWEQVANHFTTVATAKINIDDKEGMAIAQSLGVLEEGIPNVSLFATKSRQAIVKGDVIPAKQVIQLVNKFTSGLDHRDDGALLRQL